jgi:hypothetical protein
MRLLGDGWSSFGGAAIPNDRVIEVSEEDAAVYLKDRSAARRVEVLGWVEDQGEEEKPRPP